MEVGAAALGSFRTYRSRRIVSYSDPWSGPARIRRRLVRLQDMAAAIPPRRRQRFQVGRVRGSGDSTENEELQHIDIHPDMALVGLAALSLAACSTTGERLSGAGVGAVTGGAIAGPAGAVGGGVAGAVTGPAVATEMGVPHRHYCRHWRRYRRYHHS